MDSTQTTLSTETLTPAQAPTPNKQDPTQQVLPPRRRPAVKDCLQTLTDSLYQSGYFIERMERNDRIRACEWKGQSDDGRKWGEKFEDGIARPHEGASDQRVRVADLLVNERTLLCKAAMIGGRMNFTPMNANDATEAAGVGPMLKFQMSAMGNEFRDEMDYALDWSGVFGHAILAVDWLQKKQLEKRTVSMDQLVGVAAAQGMLDTGMMEELKQTLVMGAEPSPQLAQTVGTVRQQSLEDVNEMLLSKERKADLFKLLTSFDALMPKSEATSCARQLRRGEVATYYRPYLHEDRVQVETLMPLVDCLYPTFMKRCAESPWFARFHWLTADALQNRADLEDWDKDWTRKVLQNPGRSIDTARFRAEWLLAGSAVRLALSQPQAEENLKLFQVVEYYYSAMSTADATCLYREIIHGKVPTLCALHEVLPHWHGRMPFVEVRRKRKGAKYLLTASGIPEEVATDQSSIKAQFDARLDRTSKELDPPLMVPQKMTDSQDTLDTGPGAHIPMRRNGTLEHLSLPPMTIDSMEVTKDHWAMVDQFYGRPTETVPPPLVQMHQQSTVNDFLSDLSAVCRMIYDLCQERVSDADWLKICGMPKPPRDRRHLDFTITFDVRDLDLKWLKDKLSLLNDTVLSSDSDAVVNRGVYTKYVFSAIDPVMANLVIKDDAQAQQDETEDEKKACAVILSGQEPAQLANQNHASRAQYMQNAQQTNPDVVQALRSSQQKAVIWQARLKYHLDMVQQYGPGANSNAAIGRTMQQPALPDTGDSQ